MKSLLQAPPEAAALSIPAKAYAYRFFLAVCFWVVVFYLNWTRSAKTGVFILCLLNILFCGDVLFKSAWEDFRSFRMSFSVLVALCLSGAFFYNLSVTFFVSPLAHPLPDLFVVGSALVALYLWNCSRRARGRERTKVFIKKLDDFLPKSARLVNSQGEHMVFARELQTGDEIKVRAGERIPCEGVITRGRSAVDESLITGNMLAASKSAGSVVYAGTLNKTSEIWVQVQKKLAQSVIASIIHAIQNSERQRIVRRGTLSRFTPGLVVWTLLLASAAYTYFYLTNTPLRPLHNVGIFLMIIGLGCPLSLFLCEALPSGFLRWGSLRQKIHLNQSGALEVFGRADIVFFDKTGTLTYGALRIDSVHPADGCRQRDLLFCLAGAEQSVDGPFAEAVNLYAKQNKIKPRAAKSVDVLPGLGVRAVLGKDILLAGRPSWLAGLGVEIPPEPYGDKAVICAARNGKYLGYVLLADKLRPGAKEMVSTLQAAGKEVILLSGDTEASVFAIAAQSGITQFNHSVLPQTKAEIINNVRSLGKTVVMVGDGFNDIVALLRADVGLVFSSGKNVYNNWVDITLERNDLTCISELLAMQHKFISCVRGNVFLSLLCNVLLCAWLLLSPQAAISAFEGLAAGMLLGVVIIFLNSARLLKVP